MTDTLAVILDEKGNTVHSVAPTASVLDAVRKMNDARIGALLVLEDERPVGMFTERDVLTRVVDQRRDPGETPIADVMSTEVVAVKPNTTVDEAMAVITERRCRHLPVIEDGRLRGMVSIGDLTRWVTRKQRYEIQDLVNFLWAVAKMLDIPAGMPPLFATTRASRSWRISSGRTAHLRPGL